MNRLQRFPAALASLAGAGLILGIPASLCAQNAAQNPCGSTSQLSTYTLRTNAREVVVDVVVNNNDRPGRMFTQKDFRVFEGGAQQALTSFAVHGPASDSAGAATDYLPPLPGSSEEYSNLPNRPRGQSLNILLLDTLNMSMADQERGRQRMISFLKALPPGQPVALYTLGTGLTMVQDVTGRSDLLIAAANRISTHPSPLYVEHGPNQILEDDSLSGAEWMKMNSQPGAPSGWQQVLAIKQEIHALFAERGTRAMDVRVQLTLRALDELAREVAIYPGRKKLIWVSGSFPLDLRPDQQTGPDASLLRNYVPQLQRTATLLAKAQIAVYAMDVRGVMGVGADASVADSDAMNPATPSLKTVYQDEQEESIFSTQATMRELAEDTGGRAFLNNNDLTQGIRQAFDDGSTYYTLTYTPPHSAFDGKYRSIRVEVDGVKGERLQYRRGYFAAPDASGLSAEEKQQAFIAAMQRNVPASGGILLDAKISPVAGENNVQIDYAIDPRDLEMRDAPDCGQKIDIVAGAVAYTAGQQQPNRIFQVFDPTLSPGAVAEDRANGVRVRQQLALAPGPVTIRVGVLDLTSGRMGTLDVPYRLAGSK
jgi:VWFA-related protein